MFIIGGSGLLLWFPFFFSQFLPGWVFNIATLVHGEEALLAVGFIFTIHFFNGHIRPEKFPMDPVIFTGRMQRARDEGRARRRVRPTGPRGPAGGGRDHRPDAAGMRTFGYVVGGTAVILGVITVVLIVYSFVM